MQNPMTAVSNARYSMVVMAAATFFVLVQAGRRLVIERSRVLGLHRPRT